LPLGGGEILVQRLADQRVSELVAATRYGCPRREPRGRRATEGFGVRSDSDYTRFTRSAVGFTAAQFNPQLNPQGYMPFVRFGLNTTGIDTPDWTYDNRVGSTAYDWLASIRDNVTWTRGRHTFKAGGHYEYMQNNEARGGTWPGDITFSNNTSNPLNANHAFANAALGVFSQYTETDTYRITQNRQWWSEWYAQDTWQTTPRMTVDYGARFLWYSPYYRPDGHVANFDPSKYDPARAPRLYMPAIVNGARVAYDPVTGQSLNAIFIGAYVPGTGDEANGMVKETDPGVPGGFRDTLEPQIEPRLGLTYALTGAATTVLHSSVGYFHQARLGGGSLGNLAGNPPFIHNPIVYYNTLSSLFAPGVTLANRPATVEALETNYKTPGALNWSVGVRREVGWGTAVDATYTGYKAYNMEMYYDLNGVPDGARFTDLIPANRDPTAAATATPTAAALPAEFLRPYRGYQNIRVRGNFAEGDYHALQVQVNRRYIRGVQFGAAYTLQRARGTADEDVGSCCSYAFNRPLDFFYSELAQSNRNSLIVNYSWDLPGRHAGAMRALLDGWQVSGENDFVSGDWASVTFTTTDSFDFTGGDATFDTTTSIQAASLTLQAGTGTFNRPLTAGSLSLSAPARCQTFMTAPLSRSITSRIQKRFVWVAWFIEIYFASRTTACAGETGLALAGNRPKRSKAQPVANSSKAAAT